MGLNTCVIFFLENKAKQRSRQRERGRDSELCERYVGLNTCVIFFFDNRAKQRSRQRERGRDVSAMWDLIRVSFFFRPNIRTTHVSSPTSLSLRASALSQRSLSALSERAMWDLMRVSF